MNNDDWATLRHILISKAKSMCQRMFASGLSLNACSDGHLSAQKPHGQFFSMPDHMPCACWENMVSSSLAGFCLAEISPLAQMQRKTVPGIHSNQEQEVNSKETEYEKTQVHKAEV